MKNIFKYILAAAAVSFSATACVQEEAHTPGEPEVDGCYGVYFPTQDASGAHTYDPSMTPEVVFKAVRRVPEGTISVPLVVSASEEGVFQVGELVFEDGQSESEVKVTFPDSKNGVEYSVSLGIEDPQYASKYLEGATYIDFSVLRVEWKDLLNPVTNQPAIVTFNEGWWGEVHTATIKYYEVDGLRYCVATCNEGNGIWGDTQNITFDFIWDTNTFNGDGYEVIDVKKQYFGFDYNDWTSKPVEQATAPVYFYDWYHFLTTDGGYQGKWGSWANFLKANPGAYDQSYYDGNGGFFFNLKYHVPSLGGGFTPDVFDVVALVDGYVRVDYTLEMNSDYPENGEMPVEFKSGIDVASIKFICVEGKATSGQITEYSDQIAAGTAKDMGEIKEFYYDEESGFNYAGIYVTFDKTDTYTLVAGAFDKTGKMQSMGSIYLDFVAADDTDYDVTVSCGLGETPARYESAGYDKYNSLEYYATASKDATEAKIGLYKTATVDQYGMDVVINDLRNNVESVPADVLEEMKAVGGYCSLFTKLSQNTDYTLVVWATNGTKAAYAASSYATAKIPETFKSLGVGQYTEDTFTHLFELDPVTYEVEILESEQKPGKYRLVNPYGEIFPYNAPGDWDDSQDWPIDIYASNPDRVYFPEQELGIDWGVGTITIQSAGYYYMSVGNSADEVAAAGFFGTLKDGVITMPTKGVFVGALGKLYYGNANGAFKVVLPSAYTPASAPAAPAAAKRHNATLPSENILAPATLSQGVKADFSYHKDAKTATFSVVENYVKKSDASSRSISKESFRLN